MQNMTDLLSARDAIALLPCPFCGEQPYKWLQNDIETRSGVTKHVWCRSCDAQAGTDVIEDKAIAKWNTRIAARPASPVMVEVQAIKLAIMDIAIGVTANVVGDDPRVVLDQHSLDQIAAALAKLRAERGGAVTRPNDLTDSNALDQRERGGAA
jgi:Lar family restriction alleviation protein